MVLSPNFLPTLCKALQIMLKQPFLKVTILTAQLKTVTFAIDLSQNKTRLYTLLSPSYKFSKKKEKKERKKEKKKKKKKEKKERKKEKKRKKKLSSTSHYLPFISQLF